MVTSVLLALLSWISFGADKALPPAAPAPSMRAYQITPKNKVNKGCFYPIYDPRCEN